MENKTVIVEDSEGRQAFQIEQIIYLLSSILEVVLLLRFLFRFLGANPIAPFVKFIYDLSSIFISPFLYIFPATSISGYTIEWYTLIAILVYTLLTGIVVRFLRVLFFS